MRLKSGFPLTSMSAPKCSSTAVGLNKHIAYRPLPNGGYRQRPNYWHDHRNQRRDLSVDRVLLSENFVYLGDKAQAIPSRFARFVRQGRGHKVVGRNPGEQEEIAAFVDWVFSLEKGKHGRPVADKPTRHLRCEKIVEPV